MKKLSLLFASLVLAFSLLGCEETKPKVTDIDANVVSEVIEGSTVIVHVVIDDEITSLAALKELSTHIASKVYERNANTILLTPMTMTIYLYDSNASYDAEDVSYGHIIYQINQSQTHPGLSEGTNNLTLS